MSLFKKHFEQAKKEILADIKNGTLPKTVKSYWEMNDFVDANAYGGFCDEDYEVSENFELERKVQEAIEEWLKTRE
jgi:orotidine-5'-phosphate decarboxylase